MTTSHVLPTAFKATYGDSNLSPHVAFFCEYDCLPGIGHACGHNLIAEVGVAAGIGVKAAMDAAQTPFGRVGFLIICRYVLFENNIRRMKY